MTSGIRELTQWNEFQPRNLITENFYVPPKKTYVCQKIPVNKHVF